MNVPLNAEAQKGLAARLEALADGLTLHGQHGDAELQLVQECLAKALEAAQVLRGRLAYLQKVSAALWEAVHLLTTPLVPAAPAIVEEKVAGGPIQERTTP